MSEPVRESTRKVVWQRVCILGVGLLGGSIGIRLLRDGLAADVVGYGRNEFRLKTAIELGAIRQGFLTVEEAARGADFVIACLPVQEIPVALSWASKSARRTAILTDVGSTKASIVKAVGAIKMSQVFVGSHPLAGSERSGVENANDSLFDNKLVVLTPTSESNPHAIELLEGFWGSLGATSLRMSPEGHDEAMSMTSHLPHVIASILAAATPERLTPLAANGWKDSTRIASGEPKLWRQILEENQSHVLHALKNFATISGQWIDALEARDFDRVEQLLKAGKRIRDVVGNRHTSS
jgi:prephenate dehydrogenase